MAHRLRLLALTLLFIVPTTVSAEPDMKVTWSEPVTFTVDGRISFDRMIQAAGFPEPQAGLNERNFQITDRSVRDVTGFVVGFDRTVTSEKILAVMGKKHTRPARIDEFLAFLVEEDRDFAFVVSLTPVGRNPRKVPLIFIGRGLRAFSLEPWDYPWTAKLYRFLAVQK